MNLNNKGKIASRVMGGLFVFIAGVVTVNEGYKDTAYKDSAGVWTICYGETKGVKKGDTATPSECSAQLAKSLSEHSVALGDLPVDTPDVTLIGALDMTYNVGIQGFNQSKVKRLLMQKDYRAAGVAVLEWKYIHKTTASKPGAGWVLVGRNRWQFDCSQVLNGKPNKVCYGLWKRRVWQSTAIGNQFKTPQEAVSALSAL